MNCWHLLYSGSTYSAGRPPTRFYPSASLADGDLVPRAVRIRASPRLEGGPGGARQVAQGQDCRQGLATCGCRYAVDSCPQGRLQALGLVREDLKAATAALSLAMYEADSLSVEFELAVTVTGGQTASGSDR